MAYVLRELGDWDRSAELCEQLRHPGATPDDTLVADGNLGAIHAFRGDWEAARPLLTQCHDTGTRLDVMSMSVDSAAAPSRGWPSTRASSTPRATTAASCSSAGSAARITTTPSGDFAGPRASSPATATSTGRGPAPRHCRASPPRPDIRTPSPRSPTRSARQRSPKVSPTAAAEQLTRAAELHEDLEIPFERAQILLRAGVALAAAGEREAALERFVAGSRRGPPPRSDAAVPPRPPTRSRSSASRSRSGSASAPPPAATAAGCPAASWR